MPDNTGSLRQNAETMAQDFAKQRNQDSTRRRPARAATRVSPEPERTHWSWFFSGLMAGVILAIATYLGVMKLDADATELAQANASTDSPAELPAFRFGFYEELARAEVEVAPAPTEGAEVEPSPSDASSRTPATTVAEEAQFSYLLQAGSFQNRQDADNQRARIILLNMNASVVPGVVSGRTYHRVQVGPFGSRRNAEEARDELSANNIDSIHLVIR